MKPRAKFVRPSELNAWSTPGALRVLDVCFGLGYNSAALWDADSAVGLSMQWWGLELDQRPLQLALNHEGFCQLWSASTRGRLQGIERTGTWSDHSGNGCVLWGDARQTLASIPATQQFDSIFTMRSLRNAAPSSGARSSLDNSVIDLPLKAGC